MTATATTVQRFLLVSIPSGVSLVTFMGLRASPLGTPLGVTLLWLAMVGLSWYSYLSTPHGAVLRDGVLHCEMPLGRLQIPTSDIREIDARKWNRGFVSIKRPGRRIFFLRSMPGLLEMLSTIASTHEEVVVRGQVSSAAR